MAVEEARVIAHEKLVAVSKGIDRAVPVEPDGSSTTVGEICDRDLPAATAGRIPGRLALGRTAVPMSLRACRSMDISCPSGRSRAFPRPDRGRPGGGRCATASAESSP